MERPCRHRCHATEGAEYGTESNLQFLAMSFLYELKYHEPGHTQ